VEKDTLIALLTRFKNATDWITDLLGRSISWMTVVMVIMVLIVVFTRYFLQVGSIALQESVPYLHAIVFLLGISYTLQQDGHVRVDIFYRKFSSRRKALINFFGGIFFLMPVSGLILYSSWDYVWTSWAIGETSAENNGLPFVYLLKTLMIFMPITLILQGIAEVVQSLLIIIEKPDLPKTEDMEAVLDKNGRTP
jgi:TRAP-type mannitol/chloroaromatic compound transport system permease small subunit